MADVKISALPNAGAITGTGTLTGETISGGAFVGSIAGTHTLTGAAIMSSGSLGVATLNSSTLLLGTTAAIATPQTVAVGANLTLASGTLNANTGWVEQAFTSGATFTLSGPLTSNVLIPITTGATAGNKSIVIPVSTGSKWMVRTVDGTGTLAAGTAVVTISITGGGTISLAADGTATLYTPGASRTVQDTTALGWAAVA